MRSGLLLMVLFLAAGCSDGELRRADAAIAIMGHLEKTAPNHLSEKAWEVSITDVLISSPETREVRFQVSGLYNGRGDERVYVAYFQRGDQGWRFSRYGEGLVDFIAELAAQEAMHPYRGLVAALAAIRRKGSDWNSRVFEEFMDAATSGNQREYARLNRLITTGVPDDVVAEALTDEMLAEVDWGIDRSVKDHRAGTVSPIYWVASRESPDLICAFGSETSIQFFWVQEFEPTCRPGDGMWVSWMTTFEETRDRILERGAIVTP